MYQHITCRTISQLFNVLPIGYWHILGLEYQDWGEQQSNGPKPDNFIAALIPYLAYAMVFYSDISMKVLHKYFELVENEEWTRKRTHRLAQALNTNCLQYTVPIKILNKTIKSLTQVSDCGYKALFKLKSALRLN